MQPSAKTAAATKENHTSVSSANSGTAQNLLASNTAVRMNAEAVNRDRGNPIEAGADAADEEGLGEEQVMLVEGAEEAGEGLFGGAVAGVAGVGTGGIAAAGLAAVGVAGTNDNPGVSELSVGKPVGPIQVARGDSEGINIGPSEDGSVLVSGGKTDVAVLGSDTPNASINKLSVLNPEAPLPSGNPVSIDAETQTLGLNLGPLAQTEIDLSLDSLPDAVIGLAGDLASGNIQIDQLAALDIPTSIAGTDIPLTSTLNDALVQIDSALSPLTDALQSAIGGSQLGGGGLEQLTGALGDVPVLGDAVAQLDTLAANGLPTGELPLPLPTDAVIPSTGTPLDIGTGLINSSISSLPSGQLPGLDAVTSLIP